MSIWKTRSSVETLNRRAKKTLVSRLSIEYTEIGDDYLKGRMPVDHRTRQPVGLLHGGATVALTETLGSTAANLCVDEKRFYCVGMAIHANHIHSVSKGFAYGRAMPLHIGKRTHVWEIHVTNDAERLVAVSRLTLAVVSRQNLPTKMKGRDMSAKKK